MIALFLLAITLIVFAMTIPNPPSKQSQAGAALVAITWKPASAFADITLVAKSAYVLDMQTGTVLFVKNPTVQLPLASLTKVPLALVISPLRTTEERKYSPAPPTHSLQQNIRRRMSARRSGA